MSPDETPTNTEPTKDPTDPAAKVPPTEPTTAPEQPQTPPQPPEAPQDMRVVDSKVVGLTGMQKEVLANFLNVQALNQFNLRAYLQVLAESQWSIKADQFTRFGLNLEQNQVTVEFLEPVNGPNGAASLEAAPPAPAQ